MIDVIFANQKNKFPNDLDAMHRLRHSVFWDRMQWDVNCKDGREFDHYDNLNPAYLLYRGEDGEIDGCLRLLPSEGPYMLKNTFQQLMMGEQAPESSLIWESSRFAVNTEKSQGTGKGKVNRATAELLCGIIEFGLENNLTEIVSVFDLLMERVLKRAGWGPKYRIGKPQRIGKTVAVAGMFEVSEQCLETLRSLNGIEGPVLNYPKPTTEKVLEA